MVPELINNLMPQKIVYRPVIPLLISMISGITFGSKFPDYHIPAYLFSTLCTVYIIRNIVKQKGALVSPLLLFFCFGYLLIESFITPKFPPNHISKFTDSYKWKIIGIIDTMPETYHKRSKFILKTTNLTYENRKTDVTGKIRVTVRECVQELSSGDIVTFSSRIRSIRNFNNPGGFDYKKYMAFKEVWGTAYTDGRKIKILHKNSGKGIGRIIENTREKIADFIDDTITGEHKNVLKALIVGDRSGMSPILRDMFNRAGVGHLLAISGLHIGIVASVAFFLFSKFLSFIKPVLWYAWTKKGAALLSLVPVILYGLLAGMSPSTQRAVIMVTVFLMTFLIQKEQDSINTLAVAALLILIVHPPSLFSISFQLSFSAVLSIIYGLSKIKQSIGIRKNHKHKLLSKLFVSIAVSFFAIIGTLPLVMFYFNQISLIGLFANLLLIPLIGFVVVPLGLLSVFVYPFTMTVASWFVRLSAVVLDKSLEIIRFISDLPFAAVKTITPSLFEICCFYILLWAVLNIRKTFNHEDQKIPASTTGKIARYKLARGIALAILFFLAVDVFYWLDKRFWHDDFRVTILDVGQGSSALLELPGGYCMLIDGGGFSDNSVFDVGAWIVAPALWYKKIKTIDTLILSHPASDHMNGLLYIAEHFNVKNVWTNNQSAGTVGFKNFKEVLVKKRIHQSEFKDMPKMIVINNVHFYILYPPADFLNRIDKERWRNPNNNSVVIRAQFGSKSFLFPGDIMAEGEKELVDIVGEKLNATILIAPHHGSSTSSTKVFLDMVRPKTVIISSGWKNRFGFPHPDILKRYKERGYSIYRTDIDGALTLSTNGDVFEIWPFIN